MQSLEQLEQNIRSLLLQHRLQKEEIERLRKLNEDQRQEIMQTHTELVTLRRRNRHLQTAMSLLGDEAQREKARQQINYIISLVERVEQTLKQ
ncbi:MAG: hypothetical protein II970_07850 [Paludibacteraceae bacterium]|nr:hypothetical protein [Paludibacteraceae bacterium]